MAPNTVADTTSSFSSSPSALSGEAPPPGCPRGSAAALRAAPVS